MTILLLSVACFVLLALWQRAELLSEARAKKIMALKAELRKQDEAPRTWP